MYLVGLLQKDGNNYDIGVCHVCVMTWLYIATNGVKWSNDNVIALFNFLIYKGIVMYSGTVNPCVPGSSPGRGANT